MSDELLPAEMENFWNERNAIALLCLGGQAIHVSLRVIKSEVNFRRGVKKLLKMAIMISFVETTDGNIVQVCKRLLQVVISDNAIDNSLET